MTTTIAKKNDTETSAASFVDHFGPARVTRVVAPCVEVRLPDGEHRLAHMALGFPYKAVEGDVLLVAAKGDDAYVIGIIDGRGKHCLELQGDVELRAVGGTLEIAGDEGVLVRGPKVAMVTDRLKVLADSVTEKFNTSIRRVRELMSVQAGESRLIVNGNWYAQSERAQLQTEKTISINGREVHLG